MPRQDMNKRFSSLIAAIALSSAFVLPFHALAASKWVSGFYVGWMANSYPPSAIDFSALSHVMMFSALPQNDGSLDTTFFGAGSSVAIDVAQRAHAAGKKAVLAVGGAGYDSQFRSAASSTTINTFVQNLVNSVSQLGFDGVDLDWEPILSTDYASVQSLVNKLRAALPAGSLITADVGWLNANFPLNSTDGQFYATLANGLDQMNIMTYGMADDWSGWLSWHSSAVYGAASNYPSSVESSVTGYVNAGVPVGKLGLGIGFYGSAWISPVTGPRQSPGSSHVVASDGTFSYANIMAQYYSAGTYHYDSAAQAPYLSFASPYGPYACTFLSYEDATSVAAKGQYDAQRGLGGAIIWNINEGYQPGAPNPNALLAAVGSAFLGSGGDAPPSAAFTYNASYLTVTFTDQSSDSDGTIATWSWSFGDGSTSTTQNPSHTYASSGTYTVSLTVTDNAGLSSSTSKSLSVQPATAPTAPSSLSAKTASRTQINLSWSDRSNNEQGFYVERSLNASSWTRIAMVEPNVTSYSNTGLTANTTYYYRVQAYNSVGVSAYSNTASAKTKR